MVFCVVNASNLKPIIILMDEFNVYLVCSMTSPPILATVKCEHFILMCKKNDIRFRNASNEWESMIVKRAIKIHHSFVHSDDGTHKHFARILAENTLHMVICDLHNLFTPNCFHVKAMRQSRHKLSCFVASFFFIICCQNINLLNFCHIHKIHAHTSSTTLCLLKWNENV